MAEEIAPEEKPKRTPEEIAAMYKASLEVVAFIKEIIATGDTDEETTAELKRLRAFLTDLLAYDCWTTEDLEPLRAAL
jgi:hypothetical protein